MGSIWNTYGKLMGMRFPHMGPAEHMGRKSAGILQHMGIKENIWGILENIWGVRDNIWGMK